MVSVWNSRCSSLAKCSGMLPSRFRTFVSGEPGAWFIVLCVLLLAPLKDHAGRFRSEPVRTCRACISVRGFSIPPRVLRCPCNARGNFLVFRISLWHLHKLIVHQMLVKVPCIMQVPSKLWISGRSVRTRFRNESVIWCTYVCMFGTQLSLPPIL